jgi:dihydroxyacetone kinase-like predicted kinase
MVKGDSSYVTVIYGADVSEDKAQMLYDQLSMKFKDKIEITLLHGGQPVYYYLISVE